jgi:hypothetical protein
MLAMPLAAAIKLLLILLLTRVAATVVAAASALPTTAVLSTLVDALIVIVLFRVHPDLLLGSNNEPHERTPSLANRSRVDRARAAPLEVQAGFNHPPRNAASLRPSSPRFLHSSSAQQHARTRNP